MYGGSPEPLLRGACLEIRWAVRLLNWLSMVHLHQLQPSKERFASRFSVKTVSCISHVGVDIAMEWLAPMVLGRPHWWRGQLKWRCGHPIFKQHDVWAWPKGSPFFNHSFCTKIWTCPKCPLLNQDCQQRYLWPSWRSASGSPPPRGNPAGRAKVDKGWKTWWELFLRLVGIINMQILNSFWG